VSSFAIRISAAAALLGAFGIGLVGLKAAAPSVDLHAAHTAHAAAPVIEWEAGDYSFTGPETVPAGVVTVRLSNFGLEPHHAQLMRLKDGVSFDQLMAALQEEGDAAIRFVTLEGGAGAIDPHRNTEATLNLKEGSYVLVCFIPSPDGVPHLAKGMLKPIQVVAAGNAEPEPGARGVLTMSDFRFEMPDVLPSGEQTYRVVNAGPQPHELNVVRLAVGKTIQDVLVWEREPQGPPPFEAVGGLNAFEQNGAGFIRFDLPAGTYAAVCHVPDMNGSGLPHTALGMIKQFSVQ